MASLKKEREEIVDFSLNDYISNDSWGELDDKFSEWSISFCA